MLQKGDIILFRVNKKSVISLLVSFITRSSYTHVALALSSTLMIEADSFTKTRITNVPEDRQYTILRLKENPGESTLDDIVKHGLSYLGTKYDYVRLFGLILKLVFKTKWTYLINLEQRMTCTELVDIPYHSAGINLFGNVPLGYITPSDFLNSEILEEVHR